MPTNPTNSPKKSPPDYSYMRYASSKVGCLSGIESSGVHVGAKFAFGCCSNLSEYKRFYKEEIIQKAPGRSGVLY